MRILFVEDERSLLRSLLEYGRQLNWTGEGAKTCHEAREFILQFEYDAILLDINLPDGSGLELIQLIKQKSAGTAILLLTARGDLTDRLDGLAKGADDYIVKPFHLSEVAARIAAVLRRTRHQGRQMMEVGPLHLYLEERSVVANGQLLTLTKTEFDLLRYLAINQNRIVTREALAEHLLGDAASLANSFDFVYQHMKNLRKKLAAEGAEEVIQSVYGVGYRIANP